jgi:hypothetical protein
MPTHPLHPVIYREISAALKQEIIDIASPLLQELVNYGSHFLVRSEYTPTPQQDETLALDMLYLQVLEMIDAIEVLIKQASISPAYLQLRSIFEALIAIDYILQDDSKSYQRSLSWLVAHTHRRINLHESLDPTRERGKALKAELEKDEWSKTVIYPEGTDVEKAVNNLLSFLNKPHIQPIEAEYQRYKKDNKRTPEWYSLFSTLRSLEELARSVGRGAQYQLFYRHWTGVAHGEDPTRFIGRIAKSRTDQSITLIRDTSEILEVVIMSTSYFLNATRRVLTKLKPGEDFRTWYITEVRTLFLQLLQIRRQEPSLGGNNKATDQ